MMVRTIFSSLMGISRTLVNFSSLRWGYIRLVRQEELFGGLQMTIDSGSSFLHF